MLSITEKREMRRKVYSRAEIRSPVTLMILGLVKEDVYMKDSGVSMANTPVKLFKLKFSPFHVVPPIAD